MLQLATYGLPGSYLVGATVYATCGTGTVEVRTAGLFGCLWSTPVN